MRMTSRRVVQFIVMTAASLMSLGCVLWQLTADRLVSYFPLSDSASYSVKVGDRIYLRTGEYGSMQYGVTILDTSDPLDLQEVNAVGLEYLAPLWFERIDVYNDFLILESGAQIAIVDSMQIPSGDIQDWHDFHDTPDQHSRCVVYGDYLVRIVNSTDLDLTIRVYAMSEILYNPDPPLVSTLTLTPGIVNDATAVALQDNLLYVASTNSLHIIDLTNVNAPAEISSCVLPALESTGNHIEFGDGLVYVLPGDICDYFVSDTHGIVVAVDVSEISTPTIAFTVESVAVPSAISGNYLLARSGESIDVYDLSDGAASKYVKTLNVRLGMSAILPMGDFAVVPEANVRRSVGVGTVLLAPYR